MKFSFKGNRIYIIPCILLYFAIYNPPILSFNLINIVGPVSLLYLIYNKRLAKQVRYIKSYVYFLSFMVLYGIFISVIHDAPITSYSHLFYILAYDIPIAVSVTIFFYKREESLQTLFVNLVFVSFLMSLTSILAFFIPSVHDYFTVKIIEYGSRFADLLSTYRNFGFASNMTSHASFLQAMIAVFCIYLAISRKQFYFFYISLPIVFSAIINARTSLAIFLIGLLLVFYSSIRYLSSNYIPQLIIVVVMLFFIPTLFLNKITDINSNTVDWILRGISQTEAIASGEGDVGYYAYLMNDSKWILPNGVDFMFGTGRGTLGVISDIGFVSDIWRGGLFYSVSIYISFLYFLGRIKKYGIIASRERKFYVFFILLFSIIVNIKGSFFIHSDDMLFIIILSVAILQENMFPNSKFGNRVRG